MEKDNDIKKRDVEFKKVIGTLGIITPVISVILSALISYDTINGIILGVVLTLITLIIIVPYIFNIIPFNYKDPHLKILKREFNINYRIIVIVIIVLSGLITHEYFQDRTESYYRIEPGEKIEIDKISVTLIDGAWLRLKPQYLDKGFKDYDDTENNIQLIFFDQYSEVNDYEKIIRSNYTKGKKGDYNHSLAKDLTIESRYNTYTVWINLSNKKPFYHIVVMNQDKSKAVNVGSSNLKKAKEMAKSVKFL